MKPPFKAAVVLALALASFSQGEEEEPEVRIIEPTADFTEHLQDPAKWQIGQAGTLTLKMEGDSTVFLLNGDQEVFRLKSPEYVREAIQSEDRKCLVLFLGRLQGTFADKTTLVLVQPNADQLKFARVVVPENRPPDGNRWWLSNLGAVSNDGKRILGKFGEAVPNRRRYPYRWYTLELASGKILSEGLTMENGTKHAGK